jgi:hypothetical protein
MLSDRHVCTPEFVSKWVSVSNGNGKSYCMDIVRSQKVKTFETAIGRIAESFHLWSTLRAVDPTSGIIELHQEKVDRIEVNTNRHTINEWKSCVNFHSFDISTCRRAISSENIDIKQSKSKGVIPLMRIFRFISVAKARIVRECCFATTHNHRPGSSHISSPSKLKIT